MSLVRVHNFSVSLDGFGVGEDQRLEAPSPSGVVHLSFSRRRRDA